MGLITGFIEGMIRFTNDGTVRMLPFQDKIEGASFRYITENLMSETFGADGMKGASEACPYRHECSIEIRSKNIAWSLLQAATNTLARDAQVPQTRTYSVVLQDSDITAGDATIGIEGTPLVGSDILVSDIDGNTYETTYTPAVTNPSPAPASLEIEGVTAGLKVTISFQEAASGTNNEIALGSGDKLGEVGFYGRFFGCPDTLLVQINRSIISANLDLGIESDAATAAFTAMALRDPAGNFATIQRLG